MKGFWLELKYLVKGFIIVLGAVFKIIILQPREKSKSRVMIFGWYGTETLGDKLILLGIIKALKGYEGCSSIVVCSSDVAYTRETLDELYAFSNDAEVKSLLRSIKVLPEEHLMGLRENDVLVLGGGPVMDDPRLLLWAVLSMIASRKKVRFIVFGCGIGPINMVSGRLLTNLILMRASSVVLRPFPERYNGLLTGRGYSVALCPSFLCFDEIQGEPAKQGVAVNLRFVPGNYARDGDVAVVNRELINVVARYLRDREFGQLISYFSTHEFDVAGDSSVNGQVMAAIGQFSGTESTLQEVVSLLGRSKEVLAARYHGCVIAIMVGAELTGIDYTEGGGKLAALYDYFEFMAAPYNCFDLRVDALTHIRSVKLDRSLLCSHVERSLIEYREALVG